MEDFSTDLQEASKDIRSQLDQVKESIESINSMSSFSGKTAEEAKKYFEEMHLTIIESFQGLFDDLEGNLNKHIQDFQSDVDASETAKIESNYLKDVQEDIKKVFEALKNQDESIAETIKEVSDITSAKPAEFSDVNEWKTKAVKKAKEVDEDLDTFTGIGDEHDVESILSQIESVMEQAQTSKGSARFSDFKGASNMKDLEKLQGYNEDKQAEKMDQAKDEKESALKDIQETSSQDVVNKAYQELEDGDITYEQYTSILKSTKNTNDQMDEATIKENADEAFIDYLKDQGMLEDYLKEHETVEELEKINNMGEEGKEFLNVLETGYKNGDLSKEDYEELRSIVIEEGSKESGEVKGEQMLSSIIDIAGEYSEIPTSAAAGQLMKDYGNVLDGKNNLDLGPKLMDRMKSLTGALKQSGSILTAVGATVGYYDDVNNNDKTKGQAIAHNGASIAVSGGAVFTVGIAVSGPAGWAAAGASAVAGIIFKAAYDNNYLGVQTGLDWTGDRLSDAGDWAGDRIEDAQEQLGNARNWADNQMNHAADGVREAGEGIRDGVQNMTDKAVDEVGDAVSGGLDAINPFSS